MLPDNNKHGENKFFENKTLADAKSLFMTVPILKKELEKLAILSQATRETLLNKIK